jgi:glucose-6-phosphate isomerase
MRASALGFQLFYSTERVDEKRSSRCGPCKETDAIKKMQSMQAGEVVNFVHGTTSENRSALHTAMRDFFEQPNTSAAKDATKLAYAELQKLKEFWRRSKASLPISSRSVSVVQSWALKQFTSHSRRLKTGQARTLLSNVDPDEATAIFREVDPQRHLVVSVSKSGSTLETLTIKRSLETG